MIKWFDHDLLVIVPANPGKGYIIQNRPHAQSMISVSVKTLAMALYTISLMKYWVVLTFQKMNQMNQSEWNICLWANCLQLLDICSQWQSQEWTCFKGSQAKHVAKHSCRVMRDPSQASYATPLSSLTPLILANFQYHPSPSISLHVRGFFKLHCSTTVNQTVLCFRQ